MEKTLIRTVVAWTLLVGAFEVQASSYRTESSGENPLELVMDERDFSYSESFFTGRLGKDQSEIRGEIIVSKAFHVSRHERVLEGDFRIWVKGREEPCPGTVSMKRDTSVEPARLEMELSFDTNAPCEMMESVDRKLSLVESMPQTDESGCYSRWNSDTYAVRGGNKITWPRWKITAGRLPCLEDPAEPDTQVVTVLHRDDVIQAAWRPSSTSFHHLDGKWLGVETPAELGSHHCYVRAHKKNIEPISIPEEDRFFLNGLIVCPDGFDLIPVKRITDERGEAINGLSRGYVCSERDGEHALGPFTAEMVDRCLFWGGGEACMTNSWRKETAAGLYGDGECPEGAFRDPDTTYCVEGNDALGPFPEALVAKCFEGGGGRGCTAGRWNRFLLSDLLEGYCNYDAECPYGRGCRSNACVEAACHRGDSHRNILSKSCGEGKRCIYPDEWAARQGLGECVPD